MSWGGSSERCVLVASEMVRGGGDGNVRDSFPFERGEVADLAAQREDFLTATFSSAVPSSSNESSNNNQSSPHIHQNLLLRAWKIRASVCVRASLLAPTVRCR